MILLITIWGSVIAVVVMVVRSLALTIPIANRRSAQAARQIADDDILELHDIIRQALAESRNDAEFEASYRRIAALPHLAGSPRSWHVLNEILLEYWSGGEIVPSSRASAQRYLKDLDRRYDPR